MTKEEAQQKSIDLTNLLKPNYKDISAFVDLVPGTDKINISLFWNRKSQNHYTDSKSYRIKSIDYDKVLNEIIMKFL